LTTKNPQLVVADVIVDAEGKTSHGVGTQVAFNHRPSLGSRLDLGNCRVERSQKTVAEAGGSRLIKLGGLDQLGLGFGMIGQAHPIARRAASITSW